MQTSEIVKTEVAVGNTCCTAGIIDCGEIKLKCYGFKKVNMARYGVTIPFLDQKKSWPIALSRSVGG
jgi:hypothetical protein